MSHTPETCFNTLHHLMQDIYNTDPFTTKELLIQTCYDLEECDRNFHDMSVMHETMSIVFSALEKTCPAEEHERFISLKNAGLAIAAHIDHRSKRPTPPFHNRRHFLMVQVSGRAIDQLNSGRSDIPNFSAADRACSAVTDLLHDLDHPGLSNNINGHYRPMTIEVRSFDRALSYLQLHRVTQGDQALIKAAVMASDPGLPKDIMRSAYNKHFEPAFYDDDFLQTMAETFSDFDQPTHDRLHELSNLLHANPKACFLAARLGDADLLPSFGLNERRGLIETMHVNTEFIQNGNTPIYHEGEALAKPRLFALLKVLGGRPTKEDHYDVCFRTPGAQCIGNPVAFAFQKSAEEIIGFEQSSDLYNKLQLPFKPHPSLKC